MGAIERACGHIGDALMFMHEDPDLADRMEDATASLRAALDELRGLRERAVEGFISAQHEDYFGVTCTRFRHGLAEVWPADRPALLIPLDPE